MGFINAYKHLEKLCGEILGDDRKVSAYIDEMLSIQNGSYYVKNWDEDLKKLKHYRWVRNQISHEPYCTEQNMCDPEDEVWLERFHARIMNQTDPLSMYYKATKKRDSSKRSSQSAQETFPDYESNESHNSQSDNINVGFTAFMIAVLLLVMGAVILFKIFS